MRFDVGFDLFYSGQDARRVEVLSEISASELIDHALHQLLVVGILSGQNSIDCFVDAFVECTLDDAAVNGQG